MMQIRTTFLRCHTAIDFFRTSLVFLDLARSVSKPYYRIIDIIGNNSVASAPFSTDSIAVDFVVHSSSPSDSECSELPVSTIVEKKVAESQIPDF